MLSVILGRVKSQIKIKKKQQQQQLHHSYSLSPYFLATQSYPVLKCISPSRALYLFSTFIFPCICFNGADPRNNLIDQRDAAVRNHGCTQA